MMRFGKKGNWNIPFCKKPNRFAPAYITKIVNQVNNVASIIKPQWKFLNQSFEKTILDAQKDDMIYCDPPYYGRSVDYFNTWTETDEKKLFDLLREFKGKFILSTWHHSEWRANEMIEKYKEKAASPYEAAKYGYVDDIIEPDSTRPRIIAALEMMASKRETRPGKKHGNIPM